MKTFEQKIKEEIKSTQKLLKIDKYNSCLKHCPFCNGKVSLYASWNEEEWAVYCEKCNTTSPKYKKTIENAAEYWNTRYKGKE
jgi:hypothetical protein